MDRPVTSGPVDAPLRGVPAPAAPSGASPAATGGPAANPALPVRTGEVIPVRVLAVADGRVRLQWQGQSFEAVSRLSLEPGRSYLLRVTAVTPQIVLSAGHLVPGLASAVSNGLLGHGPSAWVEPLLTILGADTAAPRPGGGPAVDGALTTEDAGFRSALASLARGSGTARDLATLHRLLGHDQEARVLRLADPAANSGVPADAVTLRGTQKALALMALDQPREPSPQRTLALQDLVTGLGRIERDNAARSDQGAPLWLPLPASPDQGLRDARMFLLSRTEDGLGDAGPGEEPFTVVLLLDLTRLGELRVDVTLRGARVRALFTAVQPATVQQLGGALADLRQGLEQGGLQVDDLRVRQAPEQRLPVADLILRPRDLDALVDVHA